MRHAALTGLAIAIAYFMAAGLPVLAFSEDAMAKLTIEQRATLKAYRTARIAHDNRVDAYWEKIAAKRAKRRAKMAAGKAVTADDYVMQHEPVYAGPPRPDDIYELLPKPPAPPAQKPSIAVVKDFLAAAEKQYGFVPDRIGEDEFMIYYAMEAMKLGLSRDQVVRVFALETGGMGTHDLQSGYNARTGRAASTALGYAQLLAANSVGQIRKDGDNFAERLEELAAESGLDPQKARRYRQKAAILRRMRADALTLPEKWDVHVAFAKTPKGLGMHAMNLDGDVGPWLQVTKLKGIKQFAENRGLNRLTGGQLEMMNLAGPMSGFEMLRAPGRDAPTANFFERGGYERNPVVHNRTGAELLAKLDEIMDRNVQKPGSVQFAAIFDGIARQLASAHGAARSKEGMHMNAAVVKAEAPPAKDGKPANVKNSMDPALPQHSPAVGEQNTEAAPRMEAGMGLMAEQHSVAANANAMALESLATGAMASGFNFSENMTSSYQIGGQ